MKFILFYLFCSKRMSCSRKPSFGFMEGREFFTIEKASLKDKPSVFIKYPITIDALLETPALLFYIRKTKKKKKKHNNKNGKNEKE